MIVSSLCANSGDCPLWGVSVSVMGMYGLRPDGRWGFLRAECPIIKNSALPAYDQEERYKYMRCQDKFSCPLYTQFQPSITPDI